MQNVEKALDHFHNQLDQETQWKRAVDNLKKMNTMEHAQTWIHISSKLKDKKIHEDRKLIFKMALQKAKQEITETNVPESCFDGQLQELNKHLQEIKMLISIDIPPHIIDRISKGTDADYSYSSEEESIKQIEDTNQEEINQPPKENYEAKNNKQLLINYPS